MRLTGSILAAFLSCSAAHASDDVRTIPLAIEISPESVTASGRWVTDQTLDVPLLGYANTAEIVCSRKTMSCAEAVASLITSEDHAEVSGKLLMSLLSQYVVESWTDTEIVAKSEKRVADVTLRIDLVARSATRRHQETRAKGNPTADPRFKVDWQLR
jgi:hypothetical protein